MSDEKHDFSESGTSRQWLEQTARNGNGSNTEIGARLSYSSPWPWIRALMISCVLWAVIVSLVWRLW